MFCYPLLHFDCEPEGIDTQSDNAQKEPLDVVSKKLSAVSVKGEEVDILPDSFHDRIGGNCNLIPGSILNAVCFPRLELLAFCFILTAVQITAL